MLLIVDRALFPHVAKALELHRRWLREQGMVMPAALADCEAYVNRGLSEVQARPSSDGSRLLIDNTGVSLETPLLLTKPKAAMRLGVSLSTLKRIVDRGELRTVKVSDNTVRISAVELDRYVARLSVGVVTKDVAS